MIYVLLAVATVLWGSLVYLQAKLLLRKKVAALTGSRFQLGLCLSLAVLYTTRPRFGFWGLDQGEFELWLESMTEELSESEALELSKDVTRRLRGDRKADIWELIEQTEIGARDVYEMAREAVTALALQVRLGHDVIYSFGVGAVYCAVAVAIVSFLIVQKISK